MNQTRNQDGLWVPSIPEPLFGLYKKHCAAVRKGTRTTCKKTFWTYAGYRAHYALHHILRLG